ncbi:hypothetical protein AB6A40_008804 [Gnathostoma spinigerum]|uniref:Class II aldolase/adducin N-terminal domain-containing protein n=1 Tax=Gnathostoma spinigerum TaxID=75299 RepID=A0ABD6F0C0_9BILA
MDSKVECVCYRNCGDEDVTPGFLAQLMSQFYYLGWMSGSAGAIAVATDNSVYVSPSGLQKERLCGADFFEYDVKWNELIYRPPNKLIRETACSPLFKYIMQTRDAKCVFHTHSKYSNVLSSLITGKEFRMTNQEMIKGILCGKSGENLQNSDNLRVPIIENQNSEHLLLQDLKKALQEDPKICAVLVRNHGIFVWGPTWDKTKIMLECFEYLFEIACETYRLRSSPLIK